MMAQHVFRVRSFRLFSSNRNLHHRYVKDLILQRKTNSTSFSSCQFTSSKQLDQSWSRWGRCFSTSSTRCTMSTSVTHIGVPLPEEDMPQMVELGNRREIIIPVHHLTAGNDFQIGANYLRFYSGVNTSSEEDSSAPDPDPDFSFLIDNDPKDIQTLRPVAIRRGTPDDDHEVWIVQEEKVQDKKGKWKRWIDITDIPLKDPNNVLQTELYGMHLAQVLYAACSVEWIRGVPTERETLYHEEMPYATATDELDASMSVRQLRNFSKSQWNHCQNIQLAILQNWTDARGRLALEALMKKADYVCADAAVDVFGATGNLTREKELLTQPTMADNIGGGKWFDGSCALSAAMIQPGKLGEGEESIKREILKADETWQKLDCVPRQYTPDFYFNSMSKQSAISCIVGVVRSDRLTEEDEQQIWNQSMLGLIDRKKTCAVYITPKEAGIVTIQVEGDVVKTYRREYPFEVEGDDSLSVIDSQQMEKFFGDLVLTIWESAYNEACITE